jgi:RNA polymerase sigma-70 factor (ECF subfamily)
MRRAEAEGPAKRACNPGLGSSETRAAEWRKLKVHSMGDSEGSGAASDEELVLRMARGDREALATLFRRFGPGLCSLGERILRSSSEAEDVLHDVFLEAWRAAASYDKSRGTVRAWLGVRMRSRCFDRRKSARRGPVVLGDADAGGALSPDPSQLDPSQADPSQGVDHDRMIACLHELPEDQREVLLLGYFDGQTCSEMANSLGVPIGTVKSRVRRGLSKLRALMGIELEIGEELA